MRSSVLPADLPASSAATQWLLAGAMFGCLTLFALHWPSILNVGGTTLQPYHFGALLLLMATIVPIWIHFSVLPVVPWVLAYVFHLLLLAPALFGTTRMSLLNRQVFFIAAFFGAIAFCLRSRKTSTVLRLGSLLGVIVFFVTIEYSARQIGKSLVTAVTAYLQSGNLRVLLGQFFRPVFNALDPSGEMMVGSALTNTIGGGLLILAICYRIGFTSERRDFLGGLMMVVVVVFLLFMNARSTVLAALGGTILAALLKTARQRGMRLDDVFIWGFIATLATGIIYVVGLQGRSVTNTIIAAFSFSDESTEGRLNQFVWALDLIERSPISGNGYQPTPSGRAIHNLFLSAWTYGGLANLILILVFYLGVIWTWANWMRLLVSQPDYWRLETRAEWIATLPLLPLFRVWLSGDAGHLPFAEWVALGIFVGFVIRNDRQPRVPSRELTHYRDQVAATG